MGTRTRHTGLLSLIIPFIVAGCSLVEVQQQHYKPKIKDIPQEKELSFKSKQHLAAGASLQNVTAAKVYYKGTEPESKEAKILYDMSYRFLGLVGVNMDFDPSDPESVSKVFSEADNAIKEKDKNIHDLQEKVKKMNNDLATLNATTRDKIAEAKAESGKWRWRFGAGLWGIVIAALLIAGGLLAAQIFTGIPFFTGALGMVRTIFKGVKQTAHGLEEFKDTIKQDIAKAKAENRGYEAKAMEDALERFKSTLSKHQDAHVKEYLERIRGEYKPKQP